MSWGTCGLRYLRQVVVSGAEVLRSYDLKFSERCYVVHRALMYFDWRWENLKLGQDLDAAHLSLENMTSEEAEWCAFPTPGFFKEYGTEIQEMGEEIMRRAQSIESIQAQEDAITLEKDWYEGRWCSREIVLFGSELMRTFEEGRCDQAIIMQTLFFLFENWKDLLQEEWNDPYILLEELVNSADFPKTEEVQKADTEFCEKHQEEIRAFGLALQEDLKRRGFFEPQESATAQFFRENPEADPFK